MSEKYKWGVLIFIVISLFSIHFYGRSETVTDTTPPVTTIEFAGPIYEKDGKQWIGSQTSIWLNATDNFKVKYLYYEIWKDSDNDGVFETLVESRKVYDSSAYDKNPALGKISVEIKINEECYHKIIYYSSDYAGNIEYYGVVLNEEWRYEFEFNVVHTPDNVIFGSSPAIANLSGDENLEIFTGSDEIRVTMPNGSIARGAWRCFDAFGNVIYIMDTMTDEARSSPAIADMDEDGIKEIAAGTTSGWFLEVIEDGEYEWSFPTLSNGPVTGGNYVWHSSPAIVDVNPAVDGMEVIAGDNPHGSVWCFDGDNSDGIDEGITINAGYFPGFPNGLGVEGIEWDVLWVFDTAGRVIASPAVGDIDNDGNMEVVIGDLNGVLYIIDALTGVQEWNFSTGGAIYSSAALADIDNDGLLEIIFGSNDGNVYCLQWNGVTGIQQWSFATGGAVYSSPSIGDINADYEYEIIFGSNDYNVYCLNASGNLLWNVTTGGAVYSSPALADVEIFSYAEEWPMFRGNPFRNGFYPEKGKRLEIFIGSEDNYLYEIDGNGSIVNTFLTNGPIHTSPSVADVDGDGFINILFYDWGKVLGGLDTFWCLERGYKNINFVRVDAIAPQTVKEVVSKDKYNITSSTNIWLNSTDIGNCTVGVKYVHYEIWHDSNKDGVVDTLVESKTVYDNGVDDYNPADGVVSVLLHIVNKGINELRWYAEDYVGNVEAIHTQEHKVIVYAPSLTITKVDSKDPIRPGEFLNYTITVENTGNANATNVIIKETYDPNVTFISANPSPTIGNNEWHISLLQPGQTYTIEIKVQVHKPLENIILNNTANVTCDEGETNETYEETQVISAPELVITKEAIDTNGYPLEPGDKIHYIINITNIGDKNHKDNAGNELTDYIPQYTSYESGSLKANKGTPSYDSINKRIIWNGMVNVTETITIEFNVTVAFPLDNGTVIVNDALLYWDSDGNDVNDKTTHAYANLTVISSPLLTIEKTDSKDPVHPGDYLNYTITVENTGNANATNVVIKETYDPNVTFISANPAPTVGNNEWHISLLQPGDTYTIQIKVQVHKPLENNIFLNNSVNVTCDEGKTNETYEETLVTAPELVITKESIPATTEPNSTLMYRIRVRNYGLIEANNVVIKDVYDSRVNFISSNPMPTVSNNEWHIGVLDAGDSFVIEVYVEVPASVENGSTLVNYVNVTCEEGNYDEAIVYTPVISSPPYTYKKFYGKVINVTVLSDGREYILHYILNNTTIDLVAVDNGSGVAKTFYRVFKWDGGWEILFNWQIYGVWNPYPPYYPINLAELGEMYNFTPCGKYEIEFYSIDRAGNVEDVRWNDVFVDCFAPSSYITSIAVNNRSVDVFADAEDIGIGVEKIALYYRYSPDNVTWGNWTYYGTCYSNYSWHLSLLPDGYYEFYTLAYDLLGNHEMIPNASTNAKARCIISYPWDINVDGRVNVIDLYLVITHWMETSEDENWDPKVDVNGDEIINVVDIVEIINHWTG